MNYNIKKELLIIVYKINVSGLTRQNTEEMMQNCIESGNLSSDEELKENYTIRELYLPIHIGDSNIEVIYPIAGNSLPLESYNTIKEINKLLKEDNFNDIKPCWNRLLRELKLRILEDKDE
jgi:hypothetical protein